MADAFVQVAPDSTGSRLLTRSRTVGGQLVHEQRVLSALSDAVPINRVWTTSLRIPFPPTAAAVAAGGVHPVWACWNGIAGGGNNVSIRRLTVEVDTAIAHTALSPILRLFRTSTASGGNTLLTPAQQYTADPAFSSSVTVRANHAADGAAGTLTTGTLAATPMWAQTMPRMATAVGFSTVAEYNLMPNDSNLMAVDPLILRPSEGCALQMLAPAATAATLGIWNVVVKAVLAEFTYP